MAELAEGSVFCFKCGTRVAAAAPKNTCPKCGAEADADAVFCDACGARMSAPASTAPTQATPANRVVHAAPTTPSPSPQPAAPPAAAADAAPAARTLTVMSEVAGAGMLIGPAGTGFHKVLVDGRELGTIGVGLNKSLRATVHSETVTVEIVGRVLLRSPKLVLKLRLTGPNPTVSFKAHWMNGVITPTVRDAEILEQQSQGVYG